MEITKEFVRNCRKVRLLQEFLCQAIDQNDELQARVNILEARLAKSTGTAIKQAKEAQQ